MNSTEKEILMTVMAYYCALMVVLIGMGVDYREIVVGTVLTLLLPAVFLLDYVIERLKCIKER